MERDGSIFESDPGARNSLPQKDGVFDVVEYIRRQASLISLIDSSLVEKFSRVMDQAATSGGTIFFAGNGGSFAIAEHMVCDYTKGMKRLRKEGCRTSCLGSNGALSSALVNDFGHESALAAELELYGKKGDVLVAISSSGNSPNILKVVEKAKLMSISVLGLDGFSGGRLSDCCELSYTSEAQTYPEVEACHQVFLDSVAFTLWR